MKTWQWLALGAGALIFFKANAVAGQIEEMKDTFAEIPETAAWYAGQAVIAPEASPFSVVYSWLDKYLPLPGGNV